MHKVKVINSLVSTIYLYNRLIKQLIKIRKKKKTLIEVVCCVEHVNEL